jgi:hypothetical protein
MNLYSFIYFCPDTRGCCANAAMLAQHWPNVSMVSWWSIWWMDVLAMDILANIFGQGAHFGHILVKMSTNNTSHSSMVLESFT